MDPRYEIYRDAAGQFRWRLRDHDGILLAASRSYMDEDDCLAGLARSRELARETPTLDLTDAPPGATAGSGIADPDDRPENA